MGVEKQKQKALIAGLNSEPPMGTYDIVEFGLLKEGDSVIKVDSNSHIHVLRKNKDYDVIMIKKLDENQDDWGFDEKIRILRITKGDHVSVLKDRETYDSISKEAEKFADEIVD